MTRPYSNYSAELRGITQEMQDEWPQDVDYSKGPEERAVPRKPAAVSVEAKRDASVGANGGIHADTVENAGEAEPNLSKNTTTSPKPTRIEKTAANTGSISTSPRPPAEVISVGSIQIEPVGPSGPAGPCALTAPIEAIDDQPSRDPIEIETHLPTKMNDQATCRTAM